MRRDFRLDQGPDFTVWPQDFGPVLDWGWPVVNDPMAFRFAGSTLVEGDDAGAPLRSWFVNAWGFGSRGPQLADFSARVGWPALVADQTTLEVRIEGSVDFAGSHRDLLGVPAAPDIRFLSFQVPHGSTVVFSQSVWLCSCLAYPLRVEDRVSVNGGPVQEALWVVADRRAGGETVPWSPRADGEPPVAPLEIEYTPGDQLHPADGTGPKLCVSLSEADRMAHQDPRFVRFAAWREIHPGHVLVGASLTCLSGWGAWRLTYAEPSGETATMVVSRPLRSDPVARADEFVVTPFGEVFYASNSAPLPPWDPATAPRHQITIATAERIWDRFAAANADMGPPNLFSWGLNQPYLYEEYAELATEPFRFVVGHDHFPNPDSPGAEVRFRQALLVIDGRTGAPVRGEERGNLFAYGPTPVDPQALAGAASLANAPRAVAAPDPAVPVPVALGAAASVGLFALLVLWLVHALGWFTSSGPPPVTAGYSKIARSKLFDHPIRRAVVDAIENEPGISPPELRDILGCGWSTLTYHLHVLQRNKFVTALVDGRHKRLFSFETDHASQVRVAALRNTRTAAILKAIQADPGRGRRDVARQLGINPRTALWHLERLARAGLVTVCRSGPRVQYVATGPT